MSQGPLSCPKLPPCHTSWAHAIQTGTQSPHLRHGGLTWGLGGPHTAGAKRKARPGCGCYFLLSGEGRRTQEAISPCWCLMPGAAQAAASSQFDRQASLSGEALFPPGDRELLLTLWAPGRLAPGSGVMLLVPRGGCEMLLSPKASPAAHQLPTFHPLATQVLQGGGLPIDLVALAPLRQV